MYSIKQSDERTLRRRIAVVLSLLVAVNVAAWAAAWAASIHWPYVIAAGAIAYGFGLRHAVDADHISAIDNTTRKLMQEGKRPLGVGFYFSLGHSTVVVLLCAALAVAAAHVQHCLPLWKAVGSQVGTVVSGCFLYLVGVINLVVFCSLINRARGGTQSLSNDPSTDLFSGTGVLGRIFRPVLRMVRQSWQMYFVGFLFGLGFDTASEVGILALSARTGQVGIPLWAIMLLPLLFTAGMCLVDTLDGILMIGAYGWALVEPRRRISYNLGITFISVLVAFVVGTHELLGMFNVNDLPKGRFWSELGGNLGFVIVLAFAAAWALSALVNRLRGAPAV